MSNGGVPRNEDAYVTSEFLNRTMSCSAAAVKLNERIDNVQSMDRVGIEWRGDGGGRGETGESRVRVVRSAAKRLTL